MNGSITDSPLSFDDTKKVDTAALVDVSVGQFAGPIPSGSRRISKYNSKFRWGFGHPANIMRKRTLENGNYGIPFFIPEFKKDGEKIDLNIDEKTITTAYYKENQWGGATDKNNPWSSIVSSSRKFTPKTLESLLEARNEESLDKYRQVLTTPKFNDSKTSHDLSQMSSSRKRSYGVGEVVNCKSGYSIVNVRPFCLVHPILLGDKCIEFNKEGAVIPASFLHSPLVFNLKEKSKTLKELERYTTSPIVKIVQMLSDASKNLPTDEYLQNSLDDVYRATLGSAMDENGARAAQYNIPGREEGPEFTEIFQKRKSGFDGEDVGRLIDEVQKSPRLLKELKDTLDGVANFDRPVVLVPGMPIKLRNLLFTEVLPITTRKCHGDLKVYIIWTILSC